MKGKLITGQQNDVINEVIEMENKIIDKKFKGIIADDKTKVGNLSKYMIQHRENINYEYYRTQNYYVGSGPIEAANKYVVQNRLKLGGMIWNKDRAQHLLTLRAKLKSNLWISDVLNVVLRHFKVL
jgi:hypothetical protein